MNSVEVDLLVPAFLGGGLAVALAALVHWDARRIDVGRPKVWAGIVLFTCGGAVLGYLSLPFVPRPGLLAFAIAGPILYLFERDDAKHGDEPADPHTLASGLTDRTDSSHHPDDSGDGSDGSRHDSEDDPGEDTRE